MRGRELTSTADGQDTLPGVLLVVAKSITYGTPLDPDHYMPDDVDSASSPDPSTPPSPDLGKYGPAVERWERVLGRPAPSPTEPTGKGGALRLSPRFVEWMMGLPEGHVTDVPDLARNAQLRALGNGVVPQQAYAAIVDCLAADALLAEEVF